MIGIDTNVIIRLLVRDDAAQAASADRLVSGFTEEVPGFLSRETLLEVVWVLEKVYALSRSLVADSLERILDVDGLVVEGRDDALAAIVDYRDRGFDFPDLMIAAAGRAAGCSHTVTFDRKAAKITGMKLLH